MRLEKLKKKMADQGVDSLLVTNMNNIYYLTGFYGTAGTVFITGQANFFVTDDRYIDIAKGLIDMATWEIINSRDIFGVLAELAGRTGAQSVGFEDSLDFASYRRLAQAVPDLTLMPLADFMMSLRWIKDPEEIDIIRKACQISDRAFGEMLKFITPGKTEIEVANFLDFKMREYGASGPSFETIVASGVRSSLPHGVASHKPIEYGDCVTIDFGCYYKHYVSDMTRTFFIGQADPQLSEIYQIVLEANQELIKQIKSGLSLADFDRIPRGIIDEAGYGDKFTHSIGHGMGLDIHELPFFPKAGAKGELETGMVITDEPGIYISDFGGVRIEDDLLVTEAGCEVLTQAPKELLIVE